MRPGARVQARKDGATGTVKATFGGLALVYLDAGGRRMTPEEDWDPIAPEPG